MANKTGALKAKIDIRDYILKASNIEEFPEEYLIDNLPKIKNQGSVGSCVAHATAEILEYFNTVEVGDYTALSTDFIYGMQGVLFNKLTGGMYLRDACKIVKDYGTCTKETIPTNTKQPTCTENLKKILNNEIYEEAKYYKIKSYAQCKTESAIKHALLNHGPLLGAIKWHSKYGIDNNNVIHFNTSSKQSGHAIMVCGWTKDGWVCQNSWGKSWGDKGMFVLPYSYGLREAWTFIDDEQIEKKVKHSAFWCKIINFILNLFNF